jgi:hypothetical protein
MNAAKLSSVIVGRSVATPGWFPIAGTAVNPKWCKSEVVWMSLYFSVAVWTSIPLIHAPVPTVRQAALRQNRLG